MARLQSKPIGEPDEVTSIPKARIEIYELGGIAIGRTILEPGWRWSEDVKPIVGTPLCRYQHIGVALTGRLRVELADGTVQDIEPNSAFVIPAGHDAWVVGDQPWVMIDMAGIRSYGRVDEAAKRVLGTIVFTDIVSSTETAARLGPLHWSELLRTHLQDTTLILDRFGGRHVKSTGDGVLAFFDGSERAVRAVAAIVAGAGTRGIQIRAGVHAGEVELADGDIRGLTVHIAARIVGIAGPGEVVVSATTRDLLAGSGLKFEDAGVRELKGVEGRWQLFRLAAPAQLSAAPAPSAVRKA